MASIRIAMAAVLLAACGSGFNRAAETASVYNTVITAEIAASGGRVGRQPIGVFVETVSDGDTELTRANLRRHRYKAVGAYGLWLPALADYVVRRGVKQRLQGEFSAPHRMIDTADRATWPDQGSWLRFSPVGFDERGRHAIVFVQRGWFDGDGGDGLFLMLERTEAGWQIARRNRVYVI